MPIVTSTNRVIAGSSAEEQFRQPRVSVQAPTGMNLQPRNIQEAPPAQVPAPNSGQQNIVKEDPSGTNVVTLSPQLTALARKQQKLQQDIQAVRDREAALAKKEADYIPKSSIKTKFSENAVNALQELGLSYAEITELMISQQGNTDPNQQAIKDLSEKITKIETDQEQRVSKQYEATINQYKKDIEELVENDPKYLTVKEDGRKDAVLQHILDTFNEDGTVLSVEEAAQDIEDYLEEDAMKRASFTKVKEKLQPKVETKQLPPPAKTGLRTLTQASSTVPAKAPANQFQHMSMKDRIQAAIDRAQK